ncbi:hypothetical protein Cst_c27440 [Thermoclostridium stercorarium subsp. stercorarium DSM 8532]|uniref:Uncharacterized protein n=1 Tax=Thermoclostridium stercorarium (strain ATCC 35414 / DSM 8532 / NCIMB 11754) TaxID=1121335 RepID=L7VSG2_THES1|nr:hypothetical protein Cst_c27440 [Thermoclostridium stercorarium subsp. stercorarium DSM 8532]
MKKSEFQTGIRFTYAGACFFVCPHIVLCRLIKNRPLFRKKFRSPDPALSFSASISVKNVNVSAY